MHCIKAMHILVLSNPALLNVTQATHLLPYLRSATSVSSSSFSLLGNFADIRVRAQHEEQAIAEYVLRIFNAVIPHLPVGPASLLSRDVQSATRILLNKPASIGERVSKT